MLGMIISYTPIYRDYVICPEHFRVCEVHVHPISSPSKRNFHAMDAMWMVFLHSSPGSTSKIDMPGCVYVG